MTNEHDPLTAAESAALRGLRAGDVAPAELERRTLARVRAEGLLGAPGAGAPRRGPWIALGWAAAAAVLAFALGYYVSPRDEAAADPALARRTYLLLLHQEPGPALEPEENARRVREYTRWAVGLGDRLVGGAELHDGGRRFSTPGSTQSSPLDALDSGDLVAGYFLIAVDSPQEAGEVAATCPHLLYEGWIELREVVVHEGDPTRGGEATERVPGNSNDER